MHGGMCRCGHHVLEKILVVLAWLAGIGFIVSAWKGVPVWNWDAEGYFQAVVVFVALAFSMKVCGCCWKMMAGKTGSGMNCACNCGSCEGGKCGGTHDESHKHM